VQKILRKAKTGKQWGAGLEISRTSENKIDTISEIVFVKHGIIDLFAATPFALH
jgi:hypothetical protein